MKKNRRRRRTAKIERIEEMKDTNVLEGIFNDASLQDGGVDELEAVLGGDVRAEIALLRIYLRRLSALAKGVDDLDEAILALGAVGRACTQVASMRRSQKAFDVDARSDALEQALAEVMREFNLR